MRLPIVKLRLPLLQIFLITAFFFPPAAASAFAAPKLEITQLKDSPDPFSPNSDGIDDTVTLSAKVNYSGFLIKGTKLLAWAITVKDPSGRVVYFYLDGKLVSGNSGSVSLSRKWNGRDLLGRIVKNGQYTYTWDAQLLLTSAKEKKGTVTVSLPVLGVSVSPDSWNIGSIEAGTVITMANSDKIKVTNTGSAATTYSLCLVNPPGWQASTAAGEETYVLNAAFSRNASVNWKESRHALSTSSVRSTAVKFADDQTGVNVSPDEDRRLRMQFKAPKRTNIISEQDIEVIITAEQP